MYAGAFAVQQRFHFFFACHGGISGRRHCKRAVRRAIVYRLFRVSRHQQPVNQSKMINQAAKTYPNFKAVATTLREVKT